jgi:GNAT superfamily N-acetyltransferase
MTDTFTVARSRSAALACHDHTSDALGKLTDDALEVRSVARSDRERLEAAMTLAFSADPAARWAWPDPLQFINTFMPLVTLFGGKAVDHGSAYVIGEFVGVAQWLPPGVLPDDGPIAALFQRNMSEPKLGEVLFLFEQMAGFHPHDPHWYIPLIGGVDPAFHGWGYGSQLMRHALAVCDRDHQGIMTSDWR